MKLSKFTRIFTFLLIIVFSALAILFAIDFAEYLHIHLKAQGMNISLYFIYAVSAALCLPCVAVLIYALPLSTAIKNDTVFTEKTAKRLSVISKIMFFDCVAFLIAIVLLLFTGEFTFTPILGVVDLLGSSIAVLLRVLSGYISRAAILKEEADATL